MLVIGHFTVTNQLRTSEDCVIKPSIVHRSRCRYPIVSVGLFNQADRPVKMDRHLGSIDAVMMASIRWSHGGNSDVTVVF